MGRYLPLAMLAGGTAVAYIAAFNRARPPLLVLASFLAVLLALSVLLPWLTVRKLSLRRLAPATAHAGQELALQAEVRNQGYLPACMVEVSDTWQQMPHQGIEEQGDPGPEQVQLGLLPWLRARRQAQLPMTFPRARRGRWLLGPATLSSAFPLGILRHTRVVPGELHELLVYPKLFDVQALPLSASVLETHRDTLALPNQQGAQEFKGVRQYRPGDPLKHMHWRASARHGELLVREFEPEASARLCIALDLHADSDVGPEEWSTSEAAISIAASVSRWAAQAGVPLRLAASPEAPPAPALAGPDDSALMAWLALLGTDGHVPFAEVLADIASTTHMGETVLVLLSAPPAQVPQLLAALAGLRQAGAEPLVLVLERAAFAPDHAAATPPATDDWGAVLAAHHIPTLAVGPLTDLSKLFS
jgi:uncharacterized protein (DUF58 family)